MSQTEHYQGMSNSPEKKGLRNTLRKTEQAINYDICLNHSKITSVVCFEFAHNFDAGKN